MNTFSRLKKKLAMGSLAAVSMFYPMENKAQASETTQQSPKIEFHQNTAIPMYVRECFFVHLSRDKIQKHRQLQEIS